MTENAAESVPAENPPAPAVPRRKRRWQWRIWGAILLLVVSLLLIRQVLVWQAERHFAEVKAQLSFKLVSAKDLPTLWGPAPKPEDNAAPLYAEIWKKIDPRPRDSNATVEERAAADSCIKEFERLKIIWGLDDPRDWPDNPENRDGTDAPPPKIPPRDLARAHKFLDHYAAALSLLDQATKRPGYRADNDWWLKNPTKWSMNLPKTFDLADLLVFRATIAAEEGRWDDAYGHMRTVAMLANHMDQEPLLCNGLIATSLRGNAIHEMTRLVAKNPPSPALEEELRSLLATDPQERIRMQFVTEAALDDSILNDPELYLNEEALAKIFTYVEKRQGHTIVLPEWPVGWGLTQLRAENLLTLDRYVRSLGQPTAKVLADFHMVSPGPLNLEGPERKTLFKIPLIRKEVLEPWAFSLRKSSAHASVMASIAETFVGDQANGRMASVMLDLAAYRQEHGKYPASLAELPNANTLPRDPYTETGTGGPEDGRQFNYRLLDDGFALWSVGRKGEATSTKPLDELMDLSWGCFLRVPPKPYWERTDEKPE